MAALKLHPEPRPVLTHAESHAWRTLIESRCGIHFSEARTHRLAGALRRRMQEVGAASPADYYSLVTSPARGGLEWNALLEAVTNHETRFFRHAPTFRALCEDLLPALAKSGRPGEGVEAALWSAGCSTGEEAYSAAMVCHHVSEQFPEMRGSILASDVSERAIEMASAGRYGVRAQAEVPGDFQRYLTRLPEGAGHGVAEAVRRLVRFSRVNLMQPETYPAVLFEFILCQNVLVYFRPEAQRQVLEALTSRLKPGGFLLPGPGEVAGVHGAALRCVRLGDMQVFLKQSAERA